MHEVIHGKAVVRIGNRLFAIRKDMGRAERIHARTELKSTWNRQMTKPSIKVRSTRSITNKSF